MIRLLPRAIFLVLLALAGMIPAIPAAAGETETVAAPAPRRIMVMFKLGADHYQPGSDYGGDYGGALSERARLRMARKVANEHKLTVVEAWPMQRIGVDCVVMEIQDDRSVEAVVAELSAEPGVEWSQPLNQFEMLGAAPAAQAPYNDRLYAAQPASRRWQLANLHRYTTGRGVTIAIVDSQVDRSHPDLSGQIATAQDFVLSGKALAEKHGTGVAGIIAAKPNNAMGIAGVAPGAKVLGLRACWERPRGGATVCDSLSLARALNYALDARADVINMSLTGPRDRLLTGLIGLAISRGATVVAAVDEAHPDSSFPASVEGVVPVADERLSARGASVYIAPGLEVPTTEPEGKWNLVSGSSYAAAHVSGLAALLRQLSGNRGGRTSAASIFGPRGPIDACAAVARLSRLDAAACTTRN